ncbi:MAG: SMC family ATPase, partial [Myxococcales bacterium]|nr:SMC family ATPase [Myxococcales bacterium]
MKPIELELQWFGQYTTSQTVRFAELDPVFLITGETGAGKTTLFDAMTYALYGCGLGSRKVAATLRSQLAGEEDSTKVRFRFETNGVQWEVARSPYNFVKRKSKGKAKGTVEVDQYQTLIRLTGPGAPENIAPAGVKAKLLQVVGLKYEDFSKILVLPQGEFQQFLAMESKDRATLLKTIFPVSRHAELARLAKDSVREVAKREGELEAAANEVGRGFDEAAYPAMEATQLARLLGLQAAEQSSLEEARATQKALQDARALAEGMKTRAARVADRDSHEETRPEQALRGLRLADGRRAAVAMPVVERALALRVEIARVAKVLEDAEADRGKATVARDALSADAEVLPARALRLQEARLETDQLGARLTDLGALKKAREDEAQKRVAAERANEAVGPARVAVADAEAAVSALDALYAARDNLAAEITAANRRIQNLRLLESGAKTWELWNNEQGPQGEAAVAQAKTRLDGFETAAAEADAALAAARSRLEADAAALVAATLQPGQPCPACGSADHPHPRTGAPGEGDARAAVRLAEQSATNARNARQAQQDVVTATATRLDGERAGMTVAAQSLTQAGYGDPAAWRTAYEAARTCLTPLNDQEAELTRRLSARSTLAAKSVDARQAVEKLVAAAQSAENALASAAGFVAAAQERVGEVADLGAELLAVEARQLATRAATQTEAAAIQALQAKWSAAEAAVLAAETKVQTLTVEHAGKVTQLPAVETAVVDVLREARFGSVEEARAAALAPQTLEELQQQVNDWERTISSLTEVIAELERVIAGREPPDVPTAEDTAKRAELAATEAAEKRRDSEN